MQVRVALQDCSLAYIFSDMSHLVWRFRVDAHESSLNADVKREKCLYGMVRGR